MGETDSTAARSRDQERTFHQERLTSPQTRTSARISLRVTRKHALTRTGTHRDSQLKSSGGERRGKRRAREVSALVSRTAARATVRCNTNGIFPFYPKKKRQSFQVA